VNTCRHWPALVPQQKPFWVLADPKQIRQAMVNVLANAYKYSPAGDVVQIELLSPASSDEAPLIGICITDQGIGMTPEQSGHIFERFYRADTSGKILGTGLGMSIVHEIVQLHGGRVELQSEPGTGTAVTLWLPEFQGQSMAAINRDI